MKDVLSKVLNELFFSSKNIIGIPVKQRSKFEGWLKIELAYRLSKEKKSAESNLKKHMIIRKGPT